MELRVSNEVPEDQIWFVSDEELVAKIVNCSSDSKFEPKEGKENGSDD